MKLSDISPPPPCRSKRSHYKGSERGGFTFDFGLIAFSDPMLLVGKSAKARQKSRDTWKAQGGKKKVKKSESSDYHRKHG